MVVTMAERSKIDPKQTLRGAQPGELPLEQPTDEEIMRNRFYGYVRRFHKQQEAAMQVYKAEVAIELLDMTAQRDRIQRERDAVYKELQNVRAKLLTTRQELAGRNITVRKLKDKLRQAIGKIKQVQEARRAK
jgi:hypothetical protein